MMMMMMMMIIHTWFGWYKDWELGFVCKSQNLGWSFAFARVCGQVFKRSGSLEDFWMYMEYT